MTRRGRGCNTPGQAPFSFPKLYNAVKLCNTCNTTGILSMKRLYSTSCEWYGFFLAFFFFFLRSSDSPAQVSCTIPRKQNVAILMVGVSASVSGGDARGSVVVGLSRAEIGVDVVGVDGAVATAAAAAAAAVGGRGRGRRRRGRSGSVLHVGDRSSARDVSTRLQKKKVCFFFGGESFIR